MVVCETAIPETIHEVGVQVVDLSHIVMYWFLLHFQSVSDTCINLTSYSIRRLPPNRSRYLPSGFSVASAVSDCSHLADRQSGTIFGLLFFAELTIHQVKYRQG